MFCSGCTVSSDLSPRCFKNHFHSFLTVRHHDGQDSGRIVLFLKFVTQVFQDLILELLSKRHTRAEDREMEIEKWKHTNEASTTEFLMETVDTSIFCPRLKT